MPARFRRQNPSASFEVALFGAKASKWIAGLGCKAFCAAAARSYAPSRPKWLAGLLPGGRNAIHPRFSLVPTVDRRNENEQRNFKKRERGETSLRSGSDALPLTPAASNGLFPRRDNQLIDHFTTGFRSILLIFLNQFH